LLTAKVINIFGSRVNRKFYAISIFAAGGFSRKVVSLAKQNSAVPNAGQPARFAAIQFDSCSHARRGRPVHFNKLSDFEQSRSKALRLEARAPANRLKIRAAAE
jgi:hypothetical protein